MSDNDKYPTVREVMEGDAPFSENAFHNPQTGMYEMAEEPEAEGLEFRTDKATGLLLPQPKTKPITRIVLDTGLPINVSESVEEVLAAIDSLGTQKRLRFSGPAFADEPVYLERAYVKKIALITQDYIDLKEVELSIKMKQYQQRMAETQLDSTDKPAIATPNVGFPFPFGNTPPIKRRK